MLKGQVGEQSVIQVTRVSNLIKLNLRQAVHTTLHLSSHFYIGSKSFSEVKYTKNFVKNAQV